MQNEAEDRIDIRKLVVESPEKQAWPDFDPAKQISANDWQIIGERLRKRENISHFDYPFLLRDIEIISPGKVAELAIPEPDWQEELDNVNLSNFDSKILMLGAYNIAFPGFHRRQSINTSWVTVKNTFARAIEVVDRTESIWMVISLYPEKIPELKKRDEDLWDKLSVNLFSPINQVARASILRLMYPERRKELKIEDERWEAFKGFFELGIKHLYGKSPTIENTMALGREMKIMAAKSVRVTDKGLEIVMPEVEFQTGTEPVPEARKY